MFNASAQLVLFNIMLFNDVSLVEQQTKTSNDGKPT